MVRLVQNYIFGQVGQSWSQAGQKILKKDNQLSQFGQRCTYLICQKIDQILPAWSGWSRVGKISPTWPSW